MRYSERQSPPQLRLVQGEIPSGSDDGGLVRWKRPLARTTFRNAQVLIWSCLTLCLGWLGQRALIEGPAQRVAWEQSQVRTENRLPPRGQIFDRNGALLGETVAGYDCWLQQPRVDVRIRDLMTTMLTEATGRPAEEVEALVYHGGWRAELFRDMTPEQRDRMERWKRSLWRKQALAFAETAAGQELIATAFQGNKTEWYHAVSHAVGDVKIEQVDRRRYPLGSLAGQVLGYVTERKEGIHPGGGIELALNQQLVGDLPSLLTRSGFVAAPLGKPAESVELTIDADVQFIAEQALAVGLHRTRARAGVAIVMDAESGDLLAIANAPVFDPEVYRRFKNQPDSLLQPPDEGAPEQDASGDASASTLKLAGRTPPCQTQWPLSADTLDSWQDPLLPGLRPGVTEEHIRNHALAWQVEPGSIFKPFTMLAALESGAVKPSDTYIIGPAPLKIGAHYINDHVSPATNEVWDTTRIMVKSSNKGMAKIALQTPLPAMLNTLHKLHLGEQLLGFADEGSGKIGLPGQRWGEAERGTLGYGHGMITVTPLQMTAAMNAIATGSYVRPRLIRATQAGNGQWREVAPAPREVTFDPAAIQAVQAQLEAVVTQEGTGHRARVDGFRVAGKTGTAKKIVGGAYSKQYYSSFLGYGPVEAPRYTVLVMYDEPIVDKYGGLAAAPVFSSIMEWLLLRDKRRPSGNDPSGDVAPPDILLARR
ncbi:MAG: hypothetical protein GEEBNDBF_00851 [bacterium]|nr:hypothetical protein [bacterium]